MADPLCASIATPMTLAVIKAASREKYMLYISLSDGIMPTRINRDSKHLSFYVRRGAFV
ncbi:MAG: hypothetical protein ACK4N4_12030 [Burkholderiales bacterium]